MLLYCIQVKKYFFIEEDKEKDQNIDSFSFETMKNRNGENGRKGGKIIQFNSF